jgi:hypothetical protein
MGGTSMLGMLLGPEDTGTPARMGWLAGFFWRPLSAGDRACALVAGVSRWVA